MRWQEYIYHFEEFQKYLQRIDEKKSKLDSFRPIPGYAVQSIKSSLAIEWTYNSNSIEGNSLTLQETRMVIEDGFTIKGKSLREHFEAVNHNEGIELIESLVKPDYNLVATDILNVHALVLQKIEKEFCGRYRNSGVRIQGANFVPPNALKVNDLMDELIHWVNIDSAGLHPIVKAAIFHHRFVWIHPFFDGNGRTVRLIFNLLIMKEGYTPSIILRNDRKKYYDALHKANTGDYSKILLLVMQATERTLDIYLSNLTNSYDDYKSITQIAEEEGVPYGQEYISLLARQGKIDAFKEGRNWLTTSQAIHNYIKNRSRERALSCK